MALFTPFQLSQDITLKNRIALAPLTRARGGVERIANDLVTEYYVQRSSAGLLITEATHISDKAIGWINTPGIITEEQALGWKKVVDAVHEKGSTIFLQLWHQGRNSHSSFSKDNSLPVAPSAIAINGKIHTPVGHVDHEVPRALETHEVKEIVNEYRRAAKLAKLAGFDGVEIHAANGYLVDQFLQSKSNERTDEYGGSIENRYRFLKEIVEAILYEYPASRIGVRLSPNGLYNDMGSPDFREAFLYYATQLNNYRLAYLHIIDGLTFGFHQLGEPMTLSEFRKVFNGAIIGNNGYNKESAEKAVEEGSADLIAFGRSYLSNPDLVERFKNNWPLAPVPDYGVWYSFDAEGYITFSPYNSTN